MTKPLRFTAFQMLCPGDNGAWRDPDNRRDPLSLAFWQDQARVLEAAGFDALFFADVLGIFETRETQHELSVRDAHVFPLGDPFVLVSALAAVTRRLGFVVTASTTYEPPYLLARRFATLDHFTGGRVGWNIVTSYLDTAAANFGLPEQVPHDERYARAEDYIAALEKLWLTSWEPDAVRRDRESGVYADPAKVHRIDHQGPYYQVRGPFQSEPSPQGRPAYFQATASASGLDFAVQHADALYTMAGSVEGLRASITGLEQRARANGLAYRPQVYTNVQIVVGRTEEEAKAKRERQNRWRSEESALAWNGIDIRAYPRDTLLSQLQTFGTTRPLRSVNGRHDVTIQDYIDHLRTEQSPFTLVGTPESVVDRLAALAEAAGLDGFNIGSGFSPGIYEDFAEYLTPELRARGLLAPADAPATTLRERLVPHALPEPA
jgi:long-chain alkane monooxygenase